MISLFIFTIVFIMLYIIYIKIKNKVIEDLNKVDNLIPKNSYITVMDNIKVSEEYKNIKNKAMLVRLITHDKELKSRLIEFNNIDKYINSLNEEYIEKELSDYKEYFDNLHNYPLDYEQRRAIVTDDFTNIIIAGAGSGKSSTIIGKIRYLIEKKNIKDSEILAISFTNAAVDNLKEKLEGKDVNCYTFHGLGSKILKEKSTENYSIDDNSLNRLRKIIVNYFKTNILNDKDKLEKFVKLFSIYLYSIKDDFNSMGEKWSYESGINLKTLKGKYQEVKKNKMVKKETLSGETVKSHEELILANFLFLNGINYEYEYTYREDMTSEDNYSYKPDFYLNDYGIYLEHFGIDETGRAKQYSRIEEQKYIGEIEWKRELHKKNHTKLIETYSYEFKNGNILENLVKKLKKYHVKFNRVNFNDIYDVIINQKYNNELDSFINLISQFIAIFKGNGYEEKKFDEFIIKANNLVNNYQKTRELIFLEFIKNIYVLYEESLKNDKKIDFNDMINIAVKILDNSDKKIPLRYIFVDEYQDTSQMKYKLLKSLINKSNAKLIIVGDDWQSIFRFAGSNLDVFLNYDKYFLKPKVCRINTTHRNSQELIDISGKFIMKNKFGQIEKNLKSDKKENKPINIYYYNTRIQETLDIALDDLSKSGCKEVLILGRNKNELEKCFDNVSKEIKIREDIYKLKIDYKTIHSSKGLEADGVIVMGLKNSLNGFPNKMQNDHIIRYVLNGKDNYLYEEERRLFYVALTRTKTKCSLIVPNYKPSEFISELITIDPEKINVVFVEEDHTKNNPFCPHCKTGRLIIQENRSDNKKFVACTNYPKCNYHSKYIDIINNTIICPNCGGFLVKKKGKYGYFYGCSNYPNCKQTAKISEYDRNKE